MKAGLDIESLLDDGDKHIDGDRDPDLGFDGVLRGAEKRFDAQVLLDPFEKQFDLPAIPIECGYRQCWQREVVGQEDEPFVGRRIVELDAA